MTRGPDSVERSGQPGATRGRQRDLSDQGTRQCRAVRAARSDQGPPEGPERPGQQGTDMTVRKSRASKRRVARVRRTAIAARAPDRQRKPEPSEQLRAFRMATRRPYRLYLAGITVRTWRLHGPSVVKGPERWFSRCLFIMVCKLQDLQNT